MPAALPSALLGQVRLVPTISLLALSLQAGEALRLMSLGSLGQARPIRDSASCIVVSIDDIDSIVPAVLLSAPSA
jgi:hypothetical protein